MKKLAIVFFALLLLLSGCATLEVRPQQLDPDKGYLAGYFSLYDHMIRFINLDTGKRIKVEFLHNEHLSICSLPCGRWAIRDIEGNNRNSFSIIPIPLTMMTIIDVKPDSVTFLGDFSYGKPGFGLLFQKREIEYIYPYLKFISEIKQTYTLPPDMKLNQLRQLSMNGK